MACSRHHEHLAVANLAGGGSTHDGFQRGIEGRVILSRIRFSAWAKNRLDTGTAVQLGMAFLAAKSLDLSDGDARHPASVSASRTSSSLNGRMIAVISFIGLWLLQKVLPRVNATVSLASVAIGIDVQRAIGRTAGIGQPQRHAVGKIAGQAQLPIAIGEGGVR